MHDLQLRVIEACKRWNLTEQETNLFIESILPEAYEQFDKTPDKYTVYMISRSMASIVYFQLRLPRAIKQYLDKTS